MTPTETNAAISEAFNHPPIQTLWELLIDGKVYASHFPFEKSAIAAGECLRMTGVRKVRPIHSYKNYCNDLNAMHEAESHISDWIFYLRALSNITGIGHCPDLENSDDIKSVISATSTQRAEAFLKTIGKWKL